MPTGLELNGDWMGLLPAQDQKSHMEALRRAASRPLSPPRVGISEVICVMAAAWIRRSQWTF